MRFVKFRHVDYNGKEDGDIAIDPTEVVSLFQRYCSIVTINVALGDAYEVRGDIDGVIALLAGGE